MSFPTDAWVEIGAATTPLFSKDGATIFHLRGAGLPQVWAMDADGGNARALSAHDEKVAMLRRAPTDDRLIWGIDAGGDERQQFIIAEPGAAPRPLTAAPHVMHDFGAWSPDGARIAYAANDSDEGRFDISVMDLATGTATRLLEGPGQISVAAWSADGARLLAVEDHSSTEQRLWLIDLATAAVAKVPHPEPARFAAVRFAADGGLMGLTDQGSDWMRLCRIDAANGAVGEVYAPAGRDVEAWSLAPEGGRLLATIENDRGYAVLRVGPPDGARPVVEGLPQGIVAELAWAPDGQRLAFCAQGPTAPPGLYLWQDGAVRPLVRPDPLAEAGIDPASFVAPVLVEWRSADGTAIPGWFFLPRGPAPAGGHPAVMWVHGGPASQTRANFRVDMQMLLDHGFAVLMPNIRGSTGYGRAYLLADEVGLRPACLDDIAAGHAWLAARPEIDAGRIGIMGQSYGGWAVLAALTLLPDLWQAAVNYYGIADFATLLERTGKWRAAHRAREYGAPGVDDALFDAISPLRHVDKAQAPLLVLHGDRDPRVPMFESDQFVEAMELRQKPVRYERLTYAGHGFIRPDHRRRVYAAVAEHFTIHLRGAD